MWVFFLLQPSQGHRVWPGSLYPVAVCVGPVKCQWGPGVGRCRGMQDLEWPFTLYCYNEPLICAYLIKGLQLTGGWDGPKLLEGVWTDHSCFGNGLG